MKIYPFKLKRVTIRLIPVFLLLMSTLNIQAQVKLAQIEQKKVLVVAIEKQDQYPYHYHNKEGQLIGSDIDLARKIADKIGVRLVIDQTADSTKELLNKLNKNEADFAISKIKVNLPDGLNISFSKPYQKLNYSFLINRVKFARVKSNLNKSTNALKILGKRKAVIGTLDNYLYTLHLKKLFPLNKIILFKTKKKLLGAVLSGEVTAAFMDESESRSLILQNKSRAINLHFIKIKHSADYLALAFSWKNKNFRSWVNIYLENYPFSFTVDQLLKNYPLTKEQ